MIFSKIFLKILVEPWLQAIISKLVSLFFDVSLIGFSNKTGLSNCHTTCVFSFQKNFFAISKPRNTLSANLPTSLFASHGIVSDS